MEVNRNVCALKTSLNHIEKTLGCIFENLSSRKRESLEFIGKITTDLRLESFFRDKTDDQLRKLHFLLLLNSRLSMSIELEGDCSVGHIVGAIPRLSTSLYFALTFKYDLSKYFCEVIEQGPLSVSIELLDITNAEVNILPTGDRFKVLGAVLVALASRLTRTECKHTLKKFWEHFQILMLHYKTDSEEHIEDVDDKSVREGFKFLNLVCLLRMMTRICYCPVWNNDINSLYSIVVPIDVKKWYSEFELSDKAAVINNAYELVFFKCRDMMRDLDLDMFLSWHEIEAEGKTLQNAIGEEVFYLCETFREKNMFSLPSNTTELVDMLQSVSVKPPGYEPTVEKPIASYLQVSILENNFFDSVFLRKVKIFLEGEHFNSQIACHFVRKLFNERAYSDTDKTIVEETILKLLQEFSEAELMLLLDDFVKKNGINHFLIKEDVDFLPLIKQMTSLYSKDTIDGEQQEEEYIIEKETQLLKQVALLGFRSTCTSLGTIVKEGCSENSIPSVLMKIFQILTPLCLYQSTVEGEMTSAGLINVLDQFIKIDFPHLLPGEKKKFADLLLGLNTRRLIDRDVFLAQCLLPLLYFEENGNWSLLEDLLRLFREFYFYSERKTSISVAVMILQMAQILEESRWSIINFSTQRMKVCTEVIAVIEKLIDSYLCTTDSISSTEWLRNKLSYFSYMTNTYFTKICLPIDLNSVEANLIDLIHKPLSISHNEFYRGYLKEKNSYVMHMGKLVLICTRGELFGIVQNYGRNAHERICFIFDLISNGIGFISNTAAQFASINPQYSESIFECLGHLLNNFLGVLQNNDITVQITDSEVSYLKYINRIISILKVFPKHLNTYRFNVIKFITDRLHILRETTEDFDGDARQLLVGLYLL